MTLPTRTYDGGTQPGRHRFVRVYRRTDALPWRWHMNAVRSLGLEGPRRPLAWCGFSVWTPWFIAKVVLR